MVSILSLWMPIILSAVLVFVVSSIIHMVLRYHNSDFSALPDEDAARSALQPLDLPPGEYVIPHAADNKARQTPEYKDKADAGPVAILTVWPKGLPQMGASLAQWFGYCILVGGFAAYIAGRALAPGADYLQVFQFAGTTAFLAYSLALLQNSIWWKRSWAATMKSVFDGLVYGLLTGGAFGWLWPS